jgi:hypothetical protein
MRTLGINSREGWHPDARRKQQPDADMLSLLEALVGEWAAE